MDHFTVASQGGDSFNYFMLASLAHWFPSWGSGPSKGSPEESEGSWDDLWDREAEKKLTSVYIFRN